MQKQHLIKKFFHDKNRKLPNKLRTEEISLSLMKLFYKRKCTANIEMNHLKVNFFLLRLGTKK